jgi:hypothetical protein
MNSIFSELGASVFEAMATPGATEALDRLSAVAMLARAS